MAKKSETKRGSSRSTRQTRRSGSGKSQQGRQKQSESQMNRGEDNIDIDMEEQ